MPKPILTASEQLAKRRESLARYEERVAKDSDPTIRKLRTIHKQLAAMEYNALADMVQTEITLAVRAALDGEKKALAEAASEPTMFDEVAVR